MRYVDTSLLVAALLNEESTAVAQRWLGAQPAGKLAVIDWAITELSAALSMKLRTGELEPPQRNEVLAFCTRLTEASLQTSGRPRIPDSRACNAAACHRKGPGGPGALPLIEPAQGATPASLAPTSRRQYGFG